MGIKLKGDYQGTGFGKHYADCSIAEKKQRQINYREDIISLLNENKAKDREFIVVLRSIIYHLNTLKGQELEKYIGKLAPVGIMCPRL